MATPPQLPQGERIFGNIVAGSTAIAFGAVFCSLACVGRNANGALDFQWRWTALIWLLIGAAGGWFFWQLAWWSETAPQRRAKLWFFWYCFLLGLLTLFLFLRPLKYVAAENVRDVVIGLLLAFAVLSLFGYMIFSLVRFFSREE